MTVIGGRESIVKRVLFGICAGGIFSGAVTGLTACSVDRDGEGAGAESELRQRYPTPSDLANARAKCLENKGWPTKVHPDGSIESLFPSSEGAQFDSDDLTCQREVGIDPDAPTPLKVVKKEYASYLKGAACLNKHGWAVSAAPPLQTFLDTYETDPWIPWDDVPEADAERAERVCPLPEPTY